MVPRGQRRRDANKKLGDLAIRPTFKILFWLSTLLPRLPWLSLRLLNLLVELMHLTPSAPMFECVLLPTGAACVNLPSMECKPLPRWDRTVDRLYQCPFLCRRQPPALR
jgi:hypothetical protein